MYLAALLSAAYVKEEEPTNEEILLLPAGSATGVDYNMVVLRSTFESILVKYRASEPSSEAVLLALGTAKQDSTTVWSAMLQSEFVVSQYTKLCDAYHAKKLKAIEEKEESTPPPVNYEIDVPSTASDPSVVDMVHQYMAQFNDGSIPPVMERKTEDVPPSATEPAEQSEGSGEDDEYQPPATSKPTVGGEVDTSDIDWGAAISEHNNNDELPEGYAPPEVDGKKQTESLNALNQIIADARNTFMQYGFSKVCKCVGTTPDEAISQMAADCTELYEIEGNVDSEAYIDRMLDVLSSRCEGFIIVGLYDRANELLKPILNILYEE